MLKMRRGAVVAEMKTSARFCGVPFYRKAWKAIVCHFCGAVLKSFPPALSKLWWSLPLEGRRGRKRSCRIPSAGSGCYRSGCGGPVVWSVVIRFPGDRGLHRSVDAGFISEGWRLRQLRRRRSSFRDMKESLTSVYSLRVEEGKASMIAVLLVGSSACFEFRRS
ncbi:unnamed protein product [Brassica napus]|uniref:(rape) hypothetical protein n=1 Tax=Brassica napus TaxID=3708 RepID=A0A816LL57_BRANA|nr:unnamed protein product [Brassica napus]